MLTKGGILRKIEESRERIEKYGVRRIGLFGSYVRNEQREKSDIDLLVEFEEGEKSFSNYMDLKIFLEDLFGCKVDLVIVEDVKPLLKPDIMKEVVYA
jgi:predicted nucleotidyltransferase